MNLKKSIEKRNKNILKSQENIPNKAHFSILTRNDKFMDDSEDNTRVKWTEFAVSDRLSSRSVFTHVMGNSLNRFYLLRNWAIF